ncbi:MAG: hypothetical protein ACI4AK_07500 [Lepagella sp.]
MRKLHIFNPESDYALASGRGYYTPPGQVVELRQRLSLTPAAYASPGDIILLLDRKLDIASLDGYCLAQTKHLSIITRDCLATILDNSEKFIAEPWGWNYTVRQQLSDFSDNIINFPSLEHIDRLRELSHRRTTIDFLRLMSPLLDSEIRLPMEISEPQDCVDAFRQNDYLFFKAPWSSSGRGILSTEGLDETRITPWVTGIIRRQGSVIMEKGYRRRLDFATEWFCTAGKVDFIGFSIFEVSQRGRYRGNVEGSNEKLEEKIRRVSSKWDRRYLDLQRAAIELLIAPYYDGPLGIDMLITEDGNIHPCVEINLRHTMGMLRHLDRYYNK